MDRESVGFVMYRDYMEYFGFLSNDEKAEVLDAVFAYAFSGKATENMSRTASLVFAFVKNQIDRDHDKYEKKCEKNRKNGLLGGRPQKKEEPSERGGQEREEPAKETEREAEVKTEAVEVSEEVAGQFEEFFAEYPKKTDREAALSEYARLSPDAELHRRIMMELRSARTYPKWLKENGRYVPRASVWLSRREWEMTQKEKYRFSDPFSFETEDFFEAALERADRLT